MTRSPEEESVVNKISAGIFVLLIACVGVPVLAVVGGLSWRLFLWIAGA